MRTLLTESKDESVGRKEEGTLSEEDKDRTQQTYGSGTRDLRGRGGKSDNKTVL